MLFLCVHDLKPSLERVRDSRPNAAKAVTWVTARWPNLRQPAAAHAATGLRKHSCVLPHGLAQLPEKLGRSEHQRIVEHNPQFLAGGAQVRLCLISSAHQEGSSIKARAPIYCIVMAELAARARRAFEDAGVKFIDAGKNQPPSRRGIK